MTKARDLANIISGGFTTSDLPTLTASEIPNLDTAKITSGTFADARIASSNVSQHATSFDDNKIVNDISTLAIRQASNENKGAYNTNSMYVDVFQDSTGITSLTNVTNVDEYLASVYSQNESGGTSTLMGAISGWQWDSSNFTHSNSHNINYNVASWNHSLWTGNSTPLTGNYTVQWNQVVNNRSGESNTDNGNIQVGIYNGNISSWTGGNSIWGNDKSDAYYVTHNGALNSGNQQVVFLKQKTSQGTAEIALREQYYLQLVRDASAGTLKLYGHASNSNPYANGGTLLHTYTGYSGSADNDLMIAVGYTGGALNSGTVLVNNASIKTGITALAGSTVNNATGNFQSNAITASSSVSKMGAVITYQDNAGTNTLNTDIVLQLSADNGSNFTTATLTAMPDFASGIKMAKVNDLSVTAGTSLKYKISFANQSSGSKEARIRGVSLQY
nr:putative lectin [uncultured Mediterranean phage uvMED]